MNDLTVWTRVKERHDRIRQDEQALMTEYRAQAIDLAQLRDDYKADKAFGQALIEHGINLDRNARASYIKLGRMEEPEYQSLIKSRPDASTPRGLLRKPVSPRGETKSPTSKVAVPENEAMQALKDEVERLKAKVIEQDELERLRNVSAQHAPIPDGSNLKTITNAAAALMNKSGWTRETFFSFFSGEHMEELEKGDVTRKKTHETKCKGYCERNSVRAGEGETYKQAWDQYKKGLEQAKEIDWQKKQKEIERQIEEAYMAELERMKDPVYAQMIEESKRKSKHAFQRAKQEQKAKFMDLVKKDPKVKEIYDEMRKRLSNSHPDKGGSMEEFQSAEKALEEHIGDALGRKKRGWVRRNR